jgi:hypothetical protein
MEIYVCVLPAFACTFNSRRKEENYQQLSDELLLLLVNKTVFHKHDENDTQNRQLTKNSHGKLKSLNTKLNDLL